MSFTVIRLEDVDSLYQGVSGYVRDVDDGAVALRKAIAACSPRRRSRGRLATGEGSDEVVW